MDAVSLRRQLARFLGDDRYRKFVAELRRTGRLRFWMEQAWDQFTATHPDHDGPLVALLGALRVCELHGADLILDTVPGVPGCIDRDARYHRARRAIFPNAAVGPAYSEGATVCGPRVDVWFCPACRDAEADWRAAWGRTGVPSDLDLTRRTTLSEWAGVLPGVRGDRRAAFRAEVEAALTAGSELWQWESAGFREFAGAWGLAVVRDGCILKSWVLAKS